MDLSRAKTVLICAFLILNSFLFYQILLDKSGGKGGLFGRKEEMSRLEAALQEAGLALETPLPKGGIYLAYMLVEPWNFQPAEIIFPLREALTGEGIHPSGTETPPDLSVLATEKDNLTAYYFGEYELLISKEGQVTLKRNLPEEKKERLSLEESLEAAREFNSRVPFFKNFIFDYARKKGDEVVLKYRQEFEGWPLFAGYLKLTMGRKTPLEITFYRLEPVGFVDSKREVIPPSAALLRFMEAYPHREEKRTIVEFSLGFYSKEYYAERWEIPPVWRIRLENDEIYYINAFNGILEQ